MSLVKGGLFFFIGILLFFSLLVGNILLTTSLSLNYDNVKTQFDKIIIENINKTIQGGDVNVLFSAMQVQCRNNSFSSFVPTEINKEIVVPCSIVLEGRDSVINNIGDQIFTEYYYKEYDCALFNCPAVYGMPLVYISEHSKIYLMQKFYLSIMISLVLMVCLFFFIDSKKGILIDVGVLVIISSLPLMILSWVVSNSNFADILFSESHLVFYIMFITGIIVLISGFALKFWGFILSKIIKDEENKKEVNFAVDKRLNSSNVKKK